MPQARDEAGNVWETDAQGNPVRLVHSAQQAQQMPANPSFPYQGQKARAEAQNAGAEAQINAAKLPFARTIAAAEARKAVADASKAEADANTGAVGISPELMHLTGPDFLAKLPSSDAAQIKALDEGRMAFPTGKAAATPYWQQRLAEVSQYDPSFDAIDYNARAKTRQDFTSGTSSRNIKALNTAIGHVGQLASQIPGTASHGGLPGATTVNAIQNAIARSAGSPGITNYSQTAGAVAGELTQVFRGSGGAEADIQRYLQELDPNASADQKKAAVGNILTLLKSRLDALNDQYSKGMGIAASGLQVLDPHSVQTLSSHLPGFDPSQYGGPPPASGGGNIPPPGGSPLGFNGGGSPPPSPLQGDGSAGMAVAQGATRNLADPRTSSMVAAMVNAGAGLQDVNAALAQQGQSPVAPAEFAAVQSWMKAHPGSQYPAGSVNVNHTAPLSMLQRASGSAAGSGVANFANSLTGGIPAYLAGDQGAGAVDAMNATHPTASTVGSIGGALVGATGGELGAASAAKALFSNPDTLATALRFAPRVSDALQGGIQGYTGSGGNMGDAALGALAAPIAGKLGEKTVGAIGSAAKGVTDPAVQYLRGLNIPLTVGQALGNSGRFGAGIKKAEDALTSLPGVGNIIDARRTEGLQGLNKAAFNIGAQTTGNEVQDYGQKGLQQLAALKNRAYSNALDPVRIDANEPAFNQDLNSILNSAQLIPDVNGAQNAALSALSSRIGGAVDPTTQEMSGRGFQEAYRGLARTAKERANSDYGHEVGQVMRMGQDSLAGALERQNPGAYQGFLDANAANRRLNVLAKAVDTAKNQKGNLFSAAQLNAADAGNANALVGRVASASGDRPFAQLADAAQQVLPSRVPESGTATRTALMRLGTGAGIFGGSTGLGYAGGDTGTGAEAGLGTMLALSVLGSKGAQKALVKGLADRPDWLRALGSSIQNYAPVGGILGAGSAMYRLGNGQ